MKLLISLTKLKKLLRPSYFKYSPIVRFYVQEKSMLPTIPPESIVLVEKISLKFSAPKKGDIIVFYLKKADKYLVKRVTKVEKKGLFVLGDNPKFSQDSRHFGLIKNQDIVGKVFYLYK